MPDLACFVRISEPVEGGGGCEENVVIVDPTIFGPCRSRTESKAGGSIWFLPLEVVVWVRAARRKAGRNRGVSRLRLLHQAISQDDDPSGFAGDGGIVRGHKERCLFLDSYGTEEIHDFGSGV